MVKLTPRQRIELIEHHEKTGGTLLSTARKYNVTITSVHKILKNKSAVVKRYNEGKDGRAKRFSLSEHAVLDSEVGKWYVKQQSGEHFEGVTKWELRRIVNSVAREHKLNFNITGVWLKEFAKRNGVVLKVVSRKSEVLSFGKATVSPKKLGGFGNAILSRKNGKLGLTFKNKGICKSKGLNKVRSTTDNSVKTKDASLKDISTAKTFLDQEKIERIHQEFTHTNDIPTGLNINLKRTDNISTSQHKNDTIGAPCSTKLKPKKYQSFSDLSQIEEEIDNLKNSSTEYYNKKQKLGLSSTLKIGYKKVQGVTKLVSNLRVIARKSDVNKNLKKGSLNLKRDQDDKQALSKSSDVVNTISNNLETSYNTKRNSKGDTRVTQVQSNLSVANKGVEGHIVDIPKKNKGGRPRKNPLSPRTAKTIQTQSFYNLKSKSLLGMLNLTGNSDNISIIKPKRDPDFAQDVANGNDVVDQVNAKFRTSDCKGNSSRDQVVKKKVGRPKRVTVSPKKDLGDIIAAVDVALKSNNVNNNSPIDVLIRKNKAGCAKSDDLSPKHSIHGLLSYNKVNNNLEAASITKVNPAACQPNKNKRGRPRKILLKPGINRNVSKPKKTNIKQSLKLKVTRLTSKGQWKVKRGPALEKKKQTDVYNVKKDKNLDKGRPKNKSIANQARLIINDTNLIKVEEGCSTNDVEANDKRIDVFEFKDDTEYSGTLPIKRKRKTIIDLKPKKIAPIRECNKALSVAGKLNVPNIFEGTRSSQIYEPDKIKINPLYIPERLYLTANADNKVPKKRGRKSKNISIENIENNSSIDIFNPTDVKPGFEESLEFTPKKLNSFSKDQFAFHRSNRRSSRICQNNASPDESEKNSKRVQKLTKKKRISGDSLKNGVSKDQESREDFVNGMAVKMGGVMEDNDEYYDEYSYEYENGFKDDNLDDTDYCVAVENGNIVEITVDRSKDLDEEMRENFVDQTPSTPKIDIISDIKIISGLKTILKRDNRSTSSSYLPLNTSNEQMNESPASPPTRTMETQTSEPSSPTEQNQHPLDESWSNLFPELESDLSADELVTKINEIDFQYDSDPFKDVKIQVHSGYEAEEEESYEYEDYECEDDDGPQSQGQPMPPPNQMQQPPNNMQNSYRPPMPPNGRAPAPRGPQPGVPRMPGGPRGPQMNPRTPGARPRAPMVRPRGAGTTPVRGPMRPRMTGPQNGIRPSNQTSPAKRTPEQNNAMQAKRKKVDVLTPSDKDDDDCQVICMQPKNTDGGLPQIESVQGAESVENSIMHLSDSITLSVRNPPPKPVASPVKSDAKAVANILATRGITVTASAKSKESTSPVKQAPALPTALSLNGAVSIVASKNANGAKPAATEALPTVDLTDDSGPSGSPSKNRPGLPYRCDLCPAQYPNAMGLNKHRQTYHKTTSGMCELGVPLINIKQPGIMQKLSQMGINNYIPLPSAGPEGTYALPIISTKNPGNMANIGATQMLSLGPVRTIPRPGVSNNTNAVKK